MRSPSDTRNSSNLSRADRKSNCSVIHTLSRLCAARCHATATISIAANLPMPRCRDPARRIDRQSGREWTAGHGRHIAVKIQIAPSPSRQYESALRVRSRRSLRSGVAFLDFGSDWTGNRGARFQRSNVPAEFGKLIYERADDRSPWTRLRFARSSRRSFPRFCFGWHFPRSRSSEIYSSSPNNHVTQTR
jgi:hypothetical protein